MIKTSKTWTERFPRPEGDAAPQPGPEPEFAVPPHSSSPIGDMPEYQDFKKNIETWRARRKAFNTWILSMRKYMVAAALDEIQEKAKFDRTPADQIAWVLGVEYLNGEIGRESNPFSFMSL